MEESAYTEPAERTLQCKGNCALKEGGGEVWFDHEPQRCTVFASALRIRWHKSEAVKRFSLTAGTIEGLPNACGERKAGVSRLEGDRDIGFGLPGTA